MLLMHFSNMLYKERTGWYHKMDTLRWLMSFA